MTNKKMTINGVDLDIKEITDLLNQNREIEAIKLVLDKTKISLKDSKNIVDNIKKGNYENLSNPITTTNKERVTIKRNGNEIIVAYFDDKGNEHIVTPYDTLWEKVKSMAKDNETIKEYERTFRGR